MDSSSPTDENCNALTTGASDAARFLNWSMVEYQYQHTVYQQDVELSIDIALNDTQTQGLIMSNAQDAHIYYAINRTLELVVPRTEALNRTAHINCDDIKQSSS